MLPCIQEKLSQEAFGGAKVRLLNSKNILIADADGTRGMLYIDNLGRVVGNEITVDYLEVFASLQKMDCNEIHRV